MQKQNLSDEQGLKQIQQLHLKIISKASSISLFQYAQLLNQKVEQFLTDFYRKSSQSVLQHLKEPYKLNLLFRSEPKAQEESNKIESQPKSVKVVLSPPNIFLYTFQLPCLYKTYEHLIRSEQIQKKVDDIISEYKVLQQIGSNDLVTIQLVYLSYKRVMIIAPREFIYVRIFFKDQNNCQNKVYWIITFSVPYEPKTDKTRAQVIFTAQKIEENQKQGKIYIKVYSEVDMKTGAKAEIAKSKGFSEIKKYVQKLYDYSKSMN